MRWWAGGLHGEGAWGHALKSHWACPLADLPHTTVPKLKLKFGGFRRGGGYLLLMSVVFFWSLYEGFEAPPTHLWPLPLTAGRPATALRHVRSRIFCLFCPVCIPPPPPRQSCVAFPTSVAVSTLHTSLSREGLIVKHASAGVSRGTTVPLSLTKNTFPQISGSPRYPQRFYPPPPPPATARGINKHIRTPGCQTAYFIPPPPHLVPKFVAPSPCSCRWCCSWNILLCMQDTGCCQRRGSSFAVK